MGGVGGSWSSPWPLSKVVKSSQVRAEWLLQLINVRRSWSLVGCSQCADVHSVVECVLVSLCVCVRACVHNCRVDEIH